MKKETKKVAILVCFCILGGVLTGAGAAVWKCRGEKTPPPATAPSTLTPAEPPTTVPFEPGWNLLLVNPWNALPEDFTVELEDLEGGQAVDVRAYPDLRDMLEDAREEGLSPIICSSYRTQEKQERLYDNKISRLMGEGYSGEEARAEAGRWVAVPGTSEHQTGLALDIVARDYQVLEEEQADTPEQKWLMENAHRYGFILRYPAEKCDITGIGYEPWHYRYVGKEAAREIYEGGLCLEEYLIQLGWQGG